MKIKEEQVRHGWQLQSGLFEVFWKRGPKGMFADRVRICGTTFHYISGKERRKETHAK